MSAELDTAIAAARDAWPEVAVGRSVAATMRVRENTLWLVDGL